MGTRRMAAIQLTRREAETGDLPNVCMRCGAPATVQTRRAFVSHPFWVYVLLPLGYLPYVIVAAVLTQRVRCYTYFCPRHKNHWLIRAVFIWGGLVVLLALMVGSFALVFAMERQLGQSTTNQLVGLVCVGSFMLLFAWLMSIPLSQLTAIHPDNVTDRRLILKGVSPLFVQAVQDYRERLRDEEQEEDRGPARPRGAGPREEILDPERRVRHRPRPEPLD